MLKLDELEEELTEFETMIAEMDENGKEVNFWLKDKVSPFVFF